MTPTKKPRAGLPDFFFRIKKTGMCCEGSIKFRANGRRGNLRARMRVVPDFRMITETCARANMIKAILVVTLGLGLVLIGAVAVSNPPSIEYSER
jgi:hypothetical protein